MRSAISSTDPSSQGRGGERQRKDRQALGLGYGEQKMLASHCHEPSILGMVDTIHKHGNMVMIYLGWFIGTYWYHFDDHMTLIFHIKIDAP